MHEKRTRDRRIQKSRAQLREALGELIHEKPYDDIVVKEILGRANVGRSTFYTHFRGKDELLLSSFHDLLRAARPSVSRSPAPPCERLVWFSLPIFEHIERCRSAGDVGVGVRDHATVHEHIRHAIEELIEDEVRTTLGRSRRAAGRVSAELLTRWVAATFTLVLNDWVESAPLPAAREADALFRGLVGPTLERILA